VTYVCFGRKNRGSLLPTAKVRLGWAHRKRNILGIAEHARSPSAQPFCRDALAIVARLFRLWYRFRGQPRDRRGNPQPLDRRQLVEQSIPLQKKLFALAEAHLDDADREVRNWATALFLHCERLLTFLEVEGVEPANHVWYDRLLMFDADIDSIEGIVSKPEERSWRHRWYRWIEKWSPWR
jgi:hypothetical protein